MAEPFIGEIRMFGGTYAPVGWALCNGQQIAISDNDALYALIGSTYGGDGTTYFNLPDLRGRVPVHFNGSNLGEVGGTETVTLLATQINNHTHQLFGDSTAADKSTAAGNLLGQATAFQPYLDQTPSTPMSPVSIAPASGAQAQPHDNMAPFLCWTFIIALAGIFPPHP